MTTETLFPVILAGGASSRLWPASNRERPKWDLRLFKAPGAAHAQSLIEGAWERARAMAPAGNCFVVCGGEQAPLVRHSLRELPAENLLVEPIPRDTSGAVAYAAGAILKRVQGLGAEAERDAKMLVMPGDHVISPVERFAECARAAARAAAELDALVTFGIVAREPSVAYGYVHRGEEAHISLVQEGAPRVFRVNAFKEKPDLETAKSYLASSEYYWNGGIFMWNLSTLMREFEAQLPGHAALAHSLSRTKDAAEWDAHAREQFPELKRISIDFGIMEHAKSVATVAADFNWDDIGSWSAVGPYLDEHADNSVGPDTKLIALDAEKNLVFAPGKRVALVDVEGLAVVVNGNDILICPLARDQDVKRVSEAAQGK
ncbi:MAG TPA: sugar phosphate nucleotidyltransferase [Planctomycetota bacterium]|nr:sugar phosphate nucleotidyltransferase [Planctomycetota bacterium]